MPETLVIGLMSGTSADGIDAAVLQTDGQHFEGVNCYGSFAYRAETRAGIWKAVTDAAQHMRDDAARLHLDRLIAEDHANAVSGLIKESGLSPSLIGFHGQTIYHNPSGADGHPLGRTTIQLGDAALLARRCGIPVVHDVRRADMMAGGQGAPLAPVFHAAMLARLGVALPAVMVNIGGVANLTWVDGSGSLIGFDTGPGNALMDDYMRLYCDANFDKDGALAANGWADHRLVEHWLGLAYFAEGWPKSLDRQAFSHCLDDKSLLAKNPADAMASLALLTADSIGAAIDRLPQPPSSILIAGGGRHNRCVLAHLRDRFGRTLLEADLSEAKPQFLPDMLEAELMAFLAARHVAGLPTSFPETTGCHHPVCGGVLVAPG
ncbi:MAG: anhydro-N-acetylmuramic acid kinase [Candidatus Puniceispirillum sp.]|nr:anhydro-N-acetylmuramic acid kinase [Candidatus Puniceispirillum sp.]MBL6774497.1 anhydro-N-acetylmuramic acid kinase [Candidatus Puniceispirillum sp.]